VMRSMVMIGCGEKPKRSRRHTSGSGRKWIGPEESSRTSTPPSPAPSCSRTTSSPDCAVRRHRATRA